MNRRKRSVNRRSTYRRKWSGKTKSGRWYREKTLSLKQHDERRINNWDNKEQSK